MRHRRTGKRLGRDSAHREALFMNLSGQLIRYGRIRTTETKAKELRPKIERLVTRARVDNVHNRRMAARVLRMHDKASSKAAGEKSIVQTLFEDVAPRFVGRPGGYTRIIKLGNRSGDAAAMAFIEFVDYVPDTSGAHSHSHDFATEADAQAHTHA